jgi:dGTPase
VAKVGRTIGRALGLNEDLIEAIALGHDIGHVPYGHVGEAILDRLTRKNGIGAFCHNVQGVHCLDTLEDCNLTLQTLDGILSHDGERNDCRLTPTAPETWDSFPDKVEQARYGVAVVPATVEGCVVRFADSIAYLGRDLEDAIDVGLVEGIDGLPDCCREVFGIELGTGVARAVLDVAIKDIVNESYGHTTVGFSDDVGEAVRLFKEYNYRSIYDHPMLVREQTKIESMFTDLFSYLLDDLEREKIDSVIYRDFIDAPGLPSAYREIAAPAEMVRDFIAGMTDRYFNSTLQEIRGPRRYFRTVS